MVLHGSLKRAVGTASYDEVRRSCTHALLRLGPDTADWQSTDVGWSKGAAQELSYRILNFVVAERAAPRCFGYNQ